MNIIARIHTDFPTKFGIPRQSGLVEEIEGKIVFEKPYRIAEAIRGLDGFSHLWIIWQFSEAIREKWSPTVRPPILGGNTRMGVFATRSPFRPNPIGLSCVKIKTIVPHTTDGPIILVSGSDMVDNTPIYDIKPYIPHADCKINALGGFTTDGWNRDLKVIISDKLLSKIPPHLQKTLIEVLKIDPRPTYQNDPNRIYGMPFSFFDIRFTVKERTLTVVDVVEK